jgi:hypothetical protein
MLSVLRHLLLFGMSYAECHYAECHYAECSYAEYHGAISEYDDQHSQNDLPTL